MFFLFKLFFFVVGLFVLMTVVTGLSVFFRVREHLRDPFLKHTGNAPPPPPAGKGDIIEGEFTVLDENNKQ